VLALISVAAVAARRRCPYLLVGWLWYLGMLVPVIGVVQLGWCARADRFTYLPQIGLAVAFAWGAADLCRSWLHRRWVCGVVSALMLAALTACAWRQTCAWYDSETLWTHALACTSPNWMAHEKLGEVFMGRGHVAEAVAQYRKALEIKPDCAESHVSLANALGALGRIEEALAHLHKALEIKPEGAEIHYNLANVLARRGQVEGAVAQYRKVLELKPDFAEAQCNLATLLACRGEVDAAIACYQKALQIKPELAEARCNIAVALSEREKILKALRERREAMRIQPNNIVLLRSTAWTLATNPNASVRNGTEAMALAERALQLSGGTEPAVLDALAAAYAEAGRFADAAAAARKALAFATRQNKPASADAVRARMALYEAGKPYRQTPPPSPPKPGPATPKQAAMIDNR
jgi:tetratricopeptide (TPR) repeat protein